MKENDLTVMLKAIAMGAVLIWPMAFIVARTTEEKSKSAGKLSRFGARRY